MDDQSATFTNNDDEETKTEPPLDSDKDVFKQKVLVEGDLDSEGD